MCRIEGKRASMTHSHNTKQSKVKQSKQRNGSLSLLSLSYWNGTSFWHQHAIKEQILHTSQNQSDFRAYLCHHSFVLFTQEKCQFFHLPPLVGGNFKMKTMPTSLWNRSNFVFYVHEIEFYHCVGCGNNRNAFKYAWKFVVNYFSLFRTRSVKRKYLYWS